jgi:hypothetical protein
VSFDEWWSRPVLLDVNNAEFSRKDLVLALTNKDGGAHIDRLNEKTYALVHSNSAGFTRLGGDKALGEPIPTPIYASVRTVAEELLLTLRRSGREVPWSTVTRLIGVFDTFQASNVVDPPLMFDKTRVGVASTTFRFDTLPDVTFAVARTKDNQSDPGAYGVIPAGWLDIVGVLDATGEIVHASGVAGPIEESTPPETTVDPSISPSARFTFDNFPQGTFFANRSVEQQEVVGPFGRHIQDAGWIDLYVTLHGSTWLIGGFAGPHGS